MHTRVRSHIHWALACFVASGSFLASGATTMALFAAAAFFLSALAPLLILLPVSASTPAFLLL